MLRVQSHQNHPSPGEHICWFLHAFHHLSSYVVCCWQPQLVPTEHQFHDHSVLPDCQPLCAHVPWLQGVQALLCLSDTQSPPLGGKWKWNVFAVFTCLFAHTPQNHMKQSYYVEVVVCTHAHTYVMNSHVWHVGVCAYQSHHGYYPSFLHVSIENYT